ncbi:MAG: beta-lactamase family protein [Actinomycetia bacterium]|nr:beta-lactamase family protein [Actinomycetes bacterium]
MTGNGPGDLDAEAVARLAQRSGLEVAEGHLPSAQVALAHNGSLVLDRTFGAPEDTRYVMFSCTKAITASAVWLLLQEGQLTEDTLVADVVEGFGDNGKGATTVAHLLTHTAGFPDAEMSHADWFDKLRRLEVFAGWPAQWRPGTHFEYHGTSASWVLAHLIEALTGRDFRDYVRTEVLAATGTEGITLGSLHPPDSPAAQAEVSAATLTTVGDPPDASLAEAIGLDISAIGSDQASLLLHDDPVFRATGQPAGGAISRAAQLAMFYQALLGNTSGPWSAETLSIGTSEIRVTMPDPMTSVAANRTLGLVVAGDDGHAMMRGLGQSVSERAFGHMGAGGQVAWADPATGLSLAWFTNGLDRDPVRMGIRADEISTAAGGCVKRP